MAMAVKKQAVKVGGVEWKMSWRNFFVAASVALNIAFVVTFITMINTNSLDSMFIKEGLKRYCLDENGALFEESTEQAKELRNFTCATGEAAEPFNKAFNDYLKTKGLEPSN